MTERTTNQKSISVRGDTMEKLKAIAKAKGTDVAKMVTKRINEVCDEAGIP